MNTEFGPWATVVGRAGILEQIIAEFSFFKEEYELDDHEEGMVGGHARQRHLHEESLAR